jgi:predicted ester cyclase
MAAASVDHAADRDEAFIRQHYAAFNERRIDDAAGGFDPDAPLEHVTGCVEIGPDGYRVFASRWLGAFPDATLAVHEIHRRSTGLYEVDLLATGTHRGTLTFGSWSFRPTHLQMRLSARQLLQIGDSRIRSATLSFDVQDLVRQLATVDVVKLLDQLRRIQQLGDQIAGVQGDPARVRELLDRLGPLLDGARHVVRPYFR